MSTPAAEAASAKDSTADIGKAVGRLRSFAAAHGGTGTAVVSYLGRRGARIVVVSADGPFADLVADDLEQATAICAAADLPVAGWDRELTARISVSPADRIRMAGTGR